MKHDIIKGTPAFTVHAMICICAPYTTQVVNYMNPKAPGGIGQRFQQLGEDQEVCQMAIEFPKKLISETKFRAAFKDLEEACLVKARSAGLVLA